jgi:hypothetical protein
VINIDFIPFQPPPSAHKIQRTESPNDPTICIHSIFESGSPRRYRGPLPFSA